MGRKGFTEEDARYLESLPGAKVTRVNLPGVPSGPSRKTGGLFKPSSMKDAQNRSWDSKTEARFSHLLDNLKEEGRFKGWRYNDTKYRLADRTWYKPDFHLDIDDFRMVIIEVKGGFIAPQAKDRIKILADTSPHPFYLAQWVTKWTITRLASRASAGNECDIFREWE